MVVVIGLVNAVMSLYSTFIFLSCVIEFDEAIAILEEVRVEDPYRLDDMDMLSNMYYVKGRRADLAFLAHHCSEVDKYRVETCCIVGKPLVIPTVVILTMMGPKINPKIYHAPKKFSRKGHEDCYELN